MASIRNFEVDFVWSLPDGRLSQRAQGWTRAISDYIGAGAGSIPIGALGGDGVTTTTFLNAAGNFTTPDYPVSADATGTVGLSQVVGSAPTYMRSDAAPAISQAIIPTWTGLHTFNGGVVTTSLTASGAFGCNGASAKVSHPVNTAVAGAAGGSYTVTEQGIINNLVALVNQLRAALVANGIAV